MGITRLDTISALTGRAKIGLAAALPATPLAYYGSTVQDFESTTWKGGELYFSTDEDELYVQTATSGTGAGTWRKLDTSFNTTSTSSSTSSTTTTTSTSTSSSTSTSTSTSSTTTA